MKDVSKASSGASAGVALEQEFGLSLVRGDLAFRVQQRLGLIPEGGLGLVRRALFWSLFAWLPIAAWAVATGRAGMDAAQEPLPAHFGIHVRFLVAVPLLILAEGAVHKTLQSLLRQFVASGVIPPAEMPRFRETIGRIARLRDASLPWIAILAIALAGVTVAEVVRHAHEIDWAVDGVPGSQRPGFGGWWFLYVGRPIYLALLLGWVWRIVLAFLLFRGIARLDLAIVPTHPDRAGGLGFVAQFPAAFALVALAVSAVLAGMLAHDVVYHGVAVQALRVQMAVFVVLVVLVFLLPVLALAGPMSRARRRALLDYSALVSRHGLLVQQKWIEGRDVGEASVLAAPELGPVADVATLYDAVRNMRTVPLTKASVVPLVLAAMAPLLVVLAIQIPVGTLLQNLLKMLV